MKYQNLPLAKIKPDPAQPRKYLDKELLSDLATSIRNEGVINTIEVDEDYVIITGERRWRASKIAKLKEIPVKIISKIDPKERFIRQLHENIHLGSMTPWDTAVALEKVRQWLLQGYRGVHISRASERLGCTVGAEELSKLLGRQPSYIGHLLSLLKTTGKIREALKTKGFQFTKVAELMRVPKIYKDKLLKIITEDHSITRDSIHHIVNALIRAESYDEKDKGFKLLQEDYSGLTALQALTKVNRIVPSEDDRIKEPKQAAKKISRLVTELMEILEEHPLSSFDPIHRQFVINDVKILSGFLTSSNVKRLK